MPAGRSSLPRLLRTHADAWDHVLGLLGRLADADLARPTPVTGWVVADLVAHLGRVASSAASLEPSAEQPQALAAYLLAYAPAAAQIDAATRAAATSDVAAAVQEVRVGRLGAEEALEALAARNVTVVAAPRGPVRLDDFVATRVVELAAHADDLVRALPRAVGDPGRPAGRAALQLATRTLADVLAARVPGHSVEVRVPPFAAVQCVPGPRHTRGTPPAVVELDPATWLRIATGRLGWAEAAAGGLVRASGQRTDLSPYLPLLS